MADSENQYDDLIVIDTADDAVILHTEAPESLQIVAQRFCKLGRIVGWDDTRWPNGKTNTDLDQRVRDSPIFHIGASEL